MNYRIVNPVLEQQIKEIKSKIRLSMNGIVSDQMTQMGVRYKKNYGVSIPRIKEIASTYPPNHDLAQRLWMLGERETMILATLLEPKDIFNEETADKWLEEMSQLELLEQCTMNLFSKLPFASTLCLKWTERDNTWTQKAGFMLGARVAPQLDCSETTRLIDRGIELAVNSDIQDSKAIALCLSRLCRKGKETALYMLDKLKTKATTDTKGLAFVLNEVSQEILFLDIL